MSMQASVVTNDATKFELHLTIDGAEWAAIRVIGRIVLARSQRQLASPATTKPITT